MLTMTATVKAMDTQRWVCRIQMCRLNGTSFDDDPKRIGPETDREWQHAFRSPLAETATRSWDPREHVDELPAHRLPPVARAGEVLLLVRLEARLHHRQARAR